MEMLNKMRLLSEEEYDRLKQKQLKSYDRELRAAAFLDDEIKENFANPNLNPEQKLAFLNTAHSRLMNLMGNVQVPRATKVLQPQIPDEEPDATAAAPC